VVNAVGKRNARYLALTTTRIDASSALSMGMVQRVTTLEALDAEVDRVVAELVAGGPQAQIEIKHLMDQLSVSPVTEHVR